MSHVTRTVRRYDGLVAMVTFLATIVVLCALAPLPSW